ncbi:hypothetical protein D0T53_10420 [Dysgonomonas sp. 216]|uniref:hypothetical protein n=1 Tax=Dysgonomonas sp. 216 TaxID=2302934 RepID=UPI0013D20D27|nr:hypothetical protein [Dysgonomonas sp. 216]NDW19323.1 hypothetical protein [Dysgonomonas sp. 216]
MKTKQFLLFFSVLLFLLAGCGKNSSDKTSASSEVNNSALLSEDEEETPSPEDLGEYFEDAPVFKFKWNDGVSLLVTSESGTPLVYDDEADYSTLGILPQMYWAEKILLDFVVKEYYKNTYGEIVQDSNLKYAENYINFINSHINLVFAFPVKTENDELNKIFNKIYYDNKDYEFYIGERGYGWQSFYLSKDGTIEYGVNSSGKRYVRSPKLTLRRDEKTGYLIISKV